MRSDRGDEDHGYCGSVSLIAKALCLVRFNRQYRLFRQDKAAPGKRKGAAGRVDWVIVGALLTFLTIKINAWAHY